MGLINNSVRTKNIKNNIVWTLVLKLAGIGITFILLPMTVQYLSELQYGIWVTMFTVMNWISFLDVGIGLGLRNNLTKAISLDEKKIAKEYVSTAYVLIALISISIMVLVILISFFVNFNLLFNTQQLNGDFLQKAVILTTCFVVSSFVLSLVNQIFYACQKAKFPAYINFTANCIMLILIYFVTRISQANLLYFIGCFGMANLLSYGFYTLYLFSGNKWLLPDLHYFCIDKIKSLLGVGIQFFIIQISCIVMFSSANILITQFLGPSYVRNYDIVFKIFSVITMIHSLISTPLWSAYTEAYFKQDGIWIRNILKKMILLMIPIILLTMIIGFFINDIIKIWMNIDIDIPLNLIGSMEFYVVISTWNNIYSYFLNGISNIKVQMYCALMQAFLVIPLAYYLVSHLNLGSSGVILAISITLCISGIITPIQVFYLMRKYGF